MIIGVGENPMISLYLCSLTDTSLLSIATNVAHKLKSSLVSIAKSWWGTPKEEEVDLPPKPVIAPPSLISHSTSLTDESRFLFYFNLLIIF